MHFIMRHLTWSDVHIDSQRCVVCVSIFSAYCKIWAADRNVNEANSFKGYLIIIIMCLFLQCKINCPQLFSEQFKQIYL